MWERQKGANQAMSDIKGLFEINDHMAFSSRAQRKLKGGSMHSWVLQDRYKYEIRGFR